MRTYLSILIAATTLLQGCQNSEDLGDNYHALSEYEASDVGYPYGAIIYKSSQKYSFQETIIYSNVISYKSNDAYILVSQRPNKEIMRNIIIENVKHLIKKQKDDKMKIDFPHGKVNSKKIYFQFDSLIKINMDSSNSYKEIANDILQREPFYINQFKQVENYYIIDKKNTITNGPLNLKEFSRLKKEKNIDLDL